MSSRRRKEGGQKGARMNRGADIFQVETADEKCQVKVMIGVVCGVPFSRPRPKEMT